MEAKFNTGILGCYAEYTWCEIYMEEPPVVTQPPCKQGCSSLGGFTATTVSSTPKPWSLACGCRRCPQLLPGRLYLCDRKRASHSSHAQERNGCACRDSAHSGGREAVS